MGQADGKFEPLPVVASRAVRLGSNVITVGFPDIALQGFSPKFARSCACFGLLILRFVVLFWFGDPL
jgi:hypothetical protein